MNNLNIVHFNPDGIRGRQTNILNYIDQENTHVIAVSETHLKPNQHFSLGNFIPIRKDRTGRRKGGVAFFINNKIEFTVNDWFNKYPNLEALSVKISPSEVTRAPIDIVVYYNPPPKVIDQRLFEIVNRNSNNVVIIGDLNSPHTYFGSRITTESGIELENILARENLTLLNDPDSPTYHHPPEMLPNILDLAIVSGNLGPISSCKVGEDCGSFHLPIHVSINVGINKLPSKLIRPLKNIDWEEFKDSLREKEFNFTEESLNYNCENIDRAICNLTDNIVSTLDEVCPKRPTINRNWWKFTPEIAKLIKVKRKIRRMLKEDPIPGLKPLYNKLNKLVREKINQQKQDKWKEFVSSIEAETNVSTFWNKFKSYSNSRLNPNLGKVTNLVMENGNIAATNKLKADTFAESLGKIHQTHYDPNHDLNTETEARNFLSAHKMVFKPLEQAKQETEDKHYMLREINVLEITKTLQKCRNRSAPGEDQISYFILKNLDRENLSNIALIYNSCLKTGYFPNAWKQAKVVMLPKPGKDLTKPTSYRPISLLPAMGKIFERIVASRFSAFLEKVDYFDENQAGFRKKRSTVDQLFKLSQSVSTALKKHKKAVGVFLDVEKAFDAVWLEGLKYKLGRPEIGIPTKMIRLLSSFLTNRHLRVHQNSAISNKIELKAGTPQGSALSPLLFIFYVNDTPKPPPGVLISKFADDMAAWAIQKQEKRAEKLIQKHLDSLSEWCNKWKIKLNPSKTQVGLFTNSNNTKEITLNLGRVPLTVSNEIKFLGLTFDRKLTWRHHIDNVRHRMWLRINAIKAISGRNLGMQSKTLIHLYKMWIRPIALYGAPAYYSAAKTHLNKIQVIQNSALRIALRRNRRSHIEDLHEEGCLIPLKAEAARSSHRFMEKKVDDSLIQRLLLEHRIMLDYNRYKRARPSKTPIDLIPEYLETLL